MVEWKKLVSVSNVLYGYPFESSLFSEDSNYMPLIRIRDVKPAKASTYYSGEIREEYRIKKGDILVGMDGEFNLGRWDDRDGLLNQRVLKISEKNGCSIDGYLFHYMGPVFKKIEKETAGGSVKHLSAKVINNILIPIPSLSEQSRIVSILDTFTSSMSNLKQQIEERRKQYEYERDLLLDLEGKEGVEMKKLGEIGDVTKLAGFEFTEHVTYQEDGKIIALRGLNVRDGHLDLNQVKYIDGSNFAKLSRSKLVINDMLFTYVGTIGNVALIDENEKYYLAPNVSRIRFDESIINPKYALYIFMSQSFHRTQINKFLNSSSMKNLSMENIRKFILPIPALSTQSHIVSILDTFEQSIANLEAQLAMREKQYEYYRNQLLTFEGEEERGKT